MTENDCLWKGTPILASIDPFEQSKPTAGREPWVIGVMAIWLIAVGSGIALLGKYSLAAGPAAAAMKHWPADANLPRQSDRDTLVMVVHPNCPCSRASMSELAAIQANCSDEVFIDILFALPSGLTENIESTDLWRSACRIPGARLIVDKDGALSRAFGAKTSGQVYLYDRTGILHFSGGITDARGHAGNNSGRSAIEDIVHQRNPDISITPVFGCSL